MLVLQSSLLLFNMGVVWGGYIYIHLGIPLMYGFIIVYIPMHVPEGSIFYSYVVGGYMHCMIGKIKTEARAELAATPYICSIRIIYYSYRLNLS